MESFLHGLAECTDEPRHLPILVFINLCTVYRILLDNNTRHQKASLVPRSVASHNRQTDQQADRYIDRPTGRQIHRQTNRQTDTQTEQQPDRYTDRTGRQIHRTTGRQKHR